VHEVYFVTNKIWLLSVSEMHPLYVYLEDGIDNWVSNEFAIL
jgi:hypothetical protein